MYFFKKNTYLINQIKIQRCVCDSYYGTEGYTLEWTIIGMRGRKVKAGPRVRRDDT